MTKTILITGGTSGIGRAMVELLSLNNHNVVFVGRDETRGADVEQISGASFIRGDLSNPAEVAKVVEEFYSMYDTCDVLINNAGLWTEGPLAEVDAAEIEKVLTINSISPILVTREIVVRILDSLKQNKQTGAKIIFTNSQAGLIAKAQRATYNASKWAITGFARSLALELAPHNIGVTNLCPGYVSTELFDHAGYPRDTQGAMDPVQVAEAVKYLIDLPDSISVNEFAIKPTKYV